MLENVEKNNSNKKYNFKIGYLRAIAIILVVLVHAGNGGVNLLFDWFIPYSFHLPLLIFVSGYFYDDTIKTLSYIKKRINRLVVPYYFWNLIYLIVFLAVTSLGFYSNWFTYYPLSLENFFIEPWFQGHQYVFNLAAWFLLALFVLQLVNLLVRKTLSKLGITINEYYLFFIFLALGVLGTYLASTGYNHSYYLILGRTLFGLPFLQLGYLYKMKLERFDKPSLTRVFLLFAIQFALVLSTDDLGFAMLNLNFGGKIIQPFLSSFTGIYLCLQIASLLANNFKPIKLLKSIGDNSFSIMIHHIFGFWLLNLVYFLLSMPNFDETTFKTTLFYFYYPISGHSQTLILYAIVGISFSLGVVYLLNKLKGIAKISFRQARILKTIEVSPESETFKQ